MPQIDYFFATISPYTYLAGSRLEDVAARHGASITYKPLDPIQLFSRTGGVHPKDRHPNRQDYRLMDIERCGKQYNMPVNPKPMFAPTNMAPSSYAIIAAQRAGGGDLAGLVQSILRACWAEDKNVAEDDVIRECLVGSGFDAALADAGMLASAEEYGANLEDAVLQGVFGVPFYITDDGQKFWGADRIDQLDAHLAGKL